MCVIGQVGGGGEDFLTNWDQVSLILRVMLRSVFIQEKHISGFIISVVGI